MFVALFLHKYNIKHCFQQLSIPAQKRYISYSIMLRQLHLTALIKIRL